MSSSTIFGARRSRNGDGMRVSLIKGHVTWFFVVLLLTTSLLAAPPKSLAFMPRPLHVVSRTAWRMVVVTTRLQSSSQTEAAAQEAREAQLFWKTPLIRSASLSDLTQRDVYLKLDALQASGSFKDRGMGHLCYSLKQDGFTDLISSSGGNAGLAVATVAQRLGGMNVQVIVPETTKPLVIAKLKSLGADVTVHGENWNAADQLARQRVEENYGSAAYISPYDHPLLWTGHSSLVDELVDEDIVDLNDATIIVSVGGGGLLCGVLEGLSRRGLSSHVVAAETYGAACFGKTWQLQQQQPDELVVDPIRLSSIDSVATSLGALEVTPVVLERSLAHAGKVSSALCSDEEAVQACWEFSMNHKLLVEPACGAALAVLYSERLRTDILVDEEGPIIVEVCGGSGVTVDLLQGWKQEFGL